MGPKKTFTKMERGGGGERGYILGGRGELKKKKRQQPVLVEEQIE